VNDTVELPAGAVPAFVAAVRSHLADLTEEEREELVGGLEADLAERLAEGEGDLGDPAAYAAELRAAAGLERRSRGRLGSSAGDLDGEAVRRWLDDTHDRWDQAMSRPGLAPTWDFLTTLRPVWWVARAVVAVLLVGVVWPLVLVAAVVSVQIGRRRWWPGNRVTRSVGTRVLLLGLNLFAVAMAPLAVAELPFGGGYGSSAVYVPPTPGLQDRGLFVENVFPFDAAGRPLTGVQLFDQAGRPLVVGRDVRLRWSDDGSTSTALFPWYNGGTRLWNVFPLPARTLPERGDFAPQRVRPEAWDSTRPPALPTAPLAVVPPASLPTAAASPSPSAGLSASTSASPSASPSAGPSADSEKPRSR
jgi:hypothetical protein